MAIVGTFLADFDQFVGETRRANTELVGLGTSATRVTADATTSFSNLGSVVRNLAGAFGVGLSIGAVVQFGRAVFDTASDIHDMSLKLGISAEAVQGFKFAAEQAGSSIETVGTALNKMNVNLSEGSKGTIAALKAAGLEFEKIRTLGTEEAFLAIADAIQKIPDPMLRARVQLELFGKGGSELLPAMLENFRATADGASKMSNETVKSLEEAQDAWQKVSNQFTITTGGMIAKAIEFWSTLREQSFGGIGPAAKAAAADIELLPPVLHRTGEELKAEEAAADKAAKATLAAAEAAAKLEAAWVKATAAAAAKAESDARNLAGMEQMNDAIAAQERALQNVEGLRLQGIDAWQQELAARAASAQAQAEFDAELQKQNEQGLILVGQTAAAHIEAGQAATTGTSAAVQGYQAVAQAVALSGDAIREWINLMKYSADVNEILAENKLFTSLGQKKEIAALGGGGMFAAGGGGVVVNVSNSFFNTPADIARLGQTVGDALRSQLMANGRQVT